MPASVVVRGAHDDLGGFVAGEWNARFEKAWLDVVRRAVHEEREFATSAVEERHAHVDFESWREAVDGDTPRPLAATVDFAERARLDRLEARSAAFAAINDAQLGGSFAADGNAAKRRALLDAVERDGQRLTRLGPERLPLRNPRGRRCDRAIMRSAGAKRRSQQQRRQQAKQRGNDGHPLHPTNDIRTRRPAPHAVDGIQFPPMADPTDITDAALGPALDIERLHFKYADRGFELRLPALRLARGEEMLLVGRSGCGKSTLLQLIAGLVDPSSGSVRVGGQDMHKIAGATRDRFRGRTIGMVFQTFNLLLGFSAMENVLVAMLMSDMPKSDWKARAESLLRSLGIERLDARTEELSVGQQQRVAVARALACSPTLVLADEPTASLDPENAANAVRVLRDACREQGAALLVVSHDPSLEAHFARVERLDKLVATAQANEGARA